MITLPLHYPVTSHTDFVTAGSTFVVVKGMKKNGVCFIEEAIKRGATKIVLEHDVLLDESISNLIVTQKIEVIRVDNSRYALALLSAQAAGNPANQLRIFGITGTKGKTTSAYLLRSVFREAGYKTGLLSTAENMILDTKFPTSLTTPQPDYIHQFLRMCVDEGVTHVVMEVAAQALTLHRVAGIIFDGIIMTNFAREHLEFYASMDDYLSAKLSIINQLASDGFMVVNDDDEAFAVIPHIKYGYGLMKTNSYAHAEYDSFRPIKMQVISHTNVLSIDAPTLYGLYNVYNILGVVTLALLLKIPHAVIQQALAKFKHVPGRCERYELANGATCFMDIAHNPLSFEAFLSLVRPMTSHLIVVFGAGGDRDPGRRPLMGAIVARYADIMVITEDNPRSEDPYDIACQIIAGVSEKDAHKIVLLINRVDGIHYACSQSTKDSIVVLLGKGAESQQIYKDTIIPFSESQIISEWNASFKNNC